jgi:hypothetical protein
MSWEGFSLLLVLLDLWRRWIGFDFDLGIGCFVLGK